MAADLTGQSVVAVAPGVTAVPVAHELNLFSPATGTNVALNASAAAVFREVLGGGSDGRTRSDGAEAVTVDEVCRALAERHGVDLATMTKDVTATLAQLAELGVLSVATPAPS